MPVHLRHPAKTAAQAARYRALAKASGHAVSAAEYLAAAERAEAALAAADRCRHCGRALTDPVSRARGIGSTCWARGAR